MRVVTTTAGKTGGGGERRIGRRECRVWGWRAGVPEDVILVARRLDPSGTGGRCCALSWRPVMSGGSIGRCGTTGGQSAVDRWAYRSSPHLRLCSVRISRSRPSTTFLHQPSLGWTARRPSSRPRDGIGSACRPSGLGGGSYVLAASVEITDMSYLPPQRSQGAFRSSIRRRVDRVALSALLVLFLPFAFSEELTFGIVQAAVGEGERPPFNLDVIPFVIMACVDVTLLVVVAIILRKYLRRSAGFDHAAWYIGAALVTLALDLMQISTLFRNSIWFSIGADILWVACLAVFAAIVVNATPGDVVRDYRRRESGESPAWWNFRSVMPLILGTLAAYIAGDIYDLRLSSLVDRAAGAIDQSYFAEISQIIPLLLVALAVEASFFERAIHESFDRTVAIVTFLMLGVALILTVSALTKSNEDGDVLNVWHEVLAFSLSMEAVCVSLAAIFWGLFINARPSTDSDGDNASEQPIASRRPHACSGSPSGSGVPVELSAGSGMHGERPIGRSPQKHSESRPAEPEAPGRTTDDTSP